MRVDDDGAMGITEADSVRQFRPIANPFVAVFTVAEQYLVFSTESAPSAEEHHGESGSGIFDESSAPNAGSHHPAPLVFVLKRQI